MVSVQGIMGGSIQTAGININDASTTDSGVSAVKPWGDGDRVEFSAEAMALIKSKMDEYGTDNPLELTKDERDGIETAMDSAEGVTEQDRELLARTNDMFDQMQAQGGAGDQTQAGVQQQAAGGGGSGEVSVAQAGGTAGSSGSESSDSSETTDNTDAIDDLEQEIEKLKQEIEQLQSKAATDDESKEQLKTKRMEQSMKEAELLLLQSQSESSSDDS